MVTLGPRVIQDPVPISRPLITSKSPLCPPGSHSQAPGAETGTFGVRGVVHTACCDGDGVGEGGSGPGHRSPEALSQCPVRVSCTAPLVEGHRLRTPGLGPAREGGPRFELQGRGGDSAISGVWAEDRREARRADLAGCSGDVLGRRDTPGGPRGPAPLAVKVHPKARHWAFRVCAWPQRSRGSHQGWVAVQSRGQPRPDRPGRPSLAADLSRGRTPTGRTRT